MFDEAAAVVAATVVIFLLFEKFIGAVCGEPNADTAVFELFPSVKVVVFDITGVITGNVVVTLGVMAELGFVPKLKSGFDSVDVGVAIAPKLILTVGFTGVEDTEVEVGIDAPPNVKFKAGEDGTAALVAGIVGLAGVTVIVGLDWTEGTATFDTAGEMMVGGFKSEEIVEVTVLEATIAEEETTGFVVFPLRKLITEEVGLEVTALNSNPLLDFGMIASLEVNEGFVLVVEDGTVVDTGTV